MNLWVMDSPLENNLSWCPTYQREERFNLGHAMERSDK
jgi:hypothetical protein